MSTEVCPTCKNKCSTCGNSLSASAYIPKFNLPDFDPYREPETKMIQVHVYKRSDGSGHVWRVISCPSVGEVYQRRAGMIVPGPITNKCPDCDKYIAEVEVTL